MPLQYINELLHLPELKITDFHSENTQEEAFHLQAEPTAPIQPCPCCHTDPFVIRKGSNGWRKVRHLSAFGKKTYIYVPSIRMRCTRCCLDFVWVYGFVLPKRRYSYAFCTQAAELALGSTAVHSAYMQEAPVSTVSRMHQEMLKSENQRIGKEAWQQAENSTKLVLSVDDFAVKKGFRYNTGIHDLRGETMLDLCPGRSLAELQHYAKNNSHFQKLKPVAVIMDFAPAYHAWIRECFPAALRIVDRFHVQACVIESMQEVRKTVQSTLSSQSRKMLKSHHRLLNPPLEQLSKESKTQLEIILKYSTLLRRAWEWKEAFATWYDCSPSYEVALLWFDRWCEQGDNIVHSNIQITLRTMRSGREIITNYHRCRWTNAAIEGRHNRIKAYERRHYFTRNQANYKAGILVECNRKRLQCLFSKH